MNTNTTVVSYEEVVGQYTPDKNVTTPIITKFELTKVLGQRMEQLARGAPSLVEVDKLDLGGLVVHEKLRCIAEKELKERVLPFMIGRALPNGKREYWRLCDMIIPGY